MTANSIRARVRAEMTDEIKTIARRHLASEGANLSLRAVARDLGVVSSAIYRYFGSRDELLTALILDAYNALADAVEEREAKVPRHDLTGRWLAVCDAVRQWALAQPHEYALIYGSPVPGYRAPQDTVPAAIRTVRVLGHILQDSQKTGRCSKTAGQQLDEAIMQDVRTIKEIVAQDVPDDMMVRSLGAWVQLFGLVSFEIFGQLNNTITHRDAFFAHQMRAQAVYVGLST